VRRTAAVLALIAALGAAAIAAYVIAKRTVRWNDARTMPPPLSAAVRAYAKGDGAAGLESIHLFLKRYRAPAWETRARVLAATHLAREGQDRDLVDLLPKDLPPEDPLYAHATLLQARGWLSRGSFDRADELATRAAAVVDFPSAAEARRTRAQAQDGRGAWQDALATLDAAPTTAGAIAAARIAASHGDSEGARRRLAAALLQAPTDSDADRVRESLEETIPDAGQRLPPTERALLAERARHWLEEGRAKTAVDLLRLVRPAGAPSAATGVEALVEAEALLKLGRLAEMGPLLSRAHLAGPEEADGARYLEARRAAATGNFSAYRAGLESLGRRGAATWRERALLDLARAGEGVPSPNTAEAYRRYRLAAGSHADPLALFREAWAAYDLGRFSDAESGFARVLARPDAPEGVRLTATYWRARLAEAAGRAGEARASYTSVADGYPNHYYGALAAKHLGRANPVCPDGAGPAPLPSTLGDAGRWLAAARVLASVGLWDDAAPCYRAALRHAGAAAPALALEAALAAREAAAGADAIAIAQDVAGDRDRIPVASLPRPLWRLLYPAPSGDALTAAASATGLDPDLVAAVALQESAFNPLAVSAAGARGLLQVMPAVGAELAKSAGLARFDPSDLFDPATNLKLGCAHLSEFRRRFRSVPQALAAYNGGPTRVDRWTLDDGRDEDERFVERIPIPETRLYVKRVLAGARMYAVAWPDGLGRE
jgi:soluble lytic murein transglycosylase-like protein